jgi:hypothetical protein
MRNEAETIAALFRRAMRPQPDPADVERRNVRRLIRRAIKRQQRREMRTMLRAAFARMLTGLAEAGWTRVGEGVCAECGSEQPQYPYWFKRRARYVVCPRGHRLHLECLDLRAIESEPGIEAACPRCPET